MPMPIYLTITTEAGSKIAGSCDIKGHTGEILVSAYDHEIEIPKSPQTGLPTGKRIHHPLVVTKDLDKSTPLIMKALTQGEQLSSVKLEFPYIDKSGAEKIYQTVELKQAIVVSQAMNSKHVKEQSDAQKVHEEDVAFTYSSITVTHEDGGITHTDSWTGA